LQDYELIAQELSALAERFGELGDRVSGLDKRLAEVEGVNARLEDAALTTARALPGDFRPLGRRL
jgi:DNA anti-recombination protein RmuC